MSFSLSEGDARRSSQQKHFRMRSLSQRDRAAVCDHLTGSKTRKPQQAFQLAESSSVCPSGTCRLNLRRKLRDTSWSTRRWWQEPRGEVLTHTQMYWCHWLVLFLDLIGSCCCVSFRAERSPEEEASDEGETPAGGQHLQRHGHLEHRDPASLGLHVRLHRCVCARGCLSLFNALCVCRKGTRRVRELWWQGLPPSVRGRVWSLAIGNELNITPGTNTRSWTLFWHFC